MDGWMDKTRWRTSFTSLQTWGAGRLPFLDSDVLGFYSDSTGKMDGYSNVRGTSGEAFVVTRLAFAFYNERIN